MPQSGPGAKPGTAATNIMTGTIRSPKDISAALASAATAAVSHAEYVVNAVAAGKGSPDSAATSGAFVPTAIPGLNRARINMEPEALPSPVEPRASHMDSGDVETAIPRMSFRDVVSLHPHSSTGESARHADGEAPSSRGTLAVASDHDHERRGGHAPNPFHHKYHLSPVDTTDSEEAADLVLHLIHADATVRTTPAEALAHPFFWSTARKFLFLQTVSESTVVNGDRAVGKHAAFAADIQTRFLARLPSGCTAWGPLFPAPPALGPKGWQSPKWRNRRPEEYESSYAGPFNMYALLRFVRNFYVHGPEHVRGGLFESLPHVEAYLLSSWPWLVTEVYRVDQMHGGVYSALSLAGGAGRGTALTGGGVDADLDAIADADAAVASLVLEGEGAARTSSGKAGYEGDEAGGASAGGEPEYRDGEAAGEEVTHRPYLPHAARKQYHRNRRDSFIGLTGESPLSADDRLDVPASDDGGVGSPVRGHGSPAFHRERHYPRPPYVAAAAHTGGGGGGRGGIERGYIYSPAELEAYLPSDDEHTGGGGRTPYRSRTRSRRAMTPRYD